MGRYVDNTEIWFGDDELDFLHSTASSLHESMGLLLEVGCWKGRSTSALAKVSPVICVDTFAGTEQQGDAYVPGMDILPTFMWNMSAAGLLHRCIILRGKSHEMLDRLVGTPIRMGFVDADHTPSVAAGDFERVRNLLVPGGVLVADDCGTDGNGLAIMEASKKVGINLQLIMPKLGIWRKP
jgi:hypothetical protein